MKRFLLCGCTVILAGCATTPYEPTFRTVLPGNYQAVADCYYQKNPTGFQKTDTPSTRTSSISAARITRRFADPQSLINP